MRRKAMVAALAAWGVMAGAALSGGVPLGDDGLHKPDWLKDSFRDVREDAAEAAAARLGDEGAELRLMPVAEFVSHPQAVPHFRGIVAEMLGL